VSQLFDQIAALDQGIADRWKARTHDNPRHKLTVADVDAIISPLLTTGAKTGVKLTEKQADAIVQLVRGTGLDSGALERIRFWVRFAEKSFGLDLRPLVTDDELSPINRSLAIALKFSFTSPKTNITYAPHDYLAIGELIRQKKIMVFQAKMADLYVLTQDAGEYRSDANILFVYDRSSGAAFASTIVHESTHAIQDWLDIGMQRRFAEADAYIAGFATLDQQTFQGELSAAAFLASRLVVNRRALPGNRDWQIAYDNVVKAYDATHTDGRELLRQVEKGETESDQYKAVVAAVDQRAREFGDWAADALKTTFGGVPQGLEEALP